jgi:hypothetical protein
MIRCQPAVSDRTTTIRVRPGPVRSILIRPRHRKITGHTFREYGDEKGRPVLWDASSDDPRAWAQGFLVWAGFDWMQDPLGDIGRVNIGRNARRTSSAGRRRGTRRRQSKDGYTDSAATITGRPDAGGRAAMASAASGSRLCRERA